MDLHRLYYYSRRMVFYVPSIRCDWIVCRYNIYSHPNSSKDYEKGR